MAWKRIAVLLLSGVLAACAGYPFDGRYVGYGDRVSNDYDGDGVLNPEDRCPRSTPGVPVDAQGCEADADRDGVGDLVDRCPGTAPNVRVDSSGCAWDSDCDTVADGIDQCPNTPYGTRVNQVGCEPTAPRKITLRGVHFANDSAELGPSAHTILDGVAAELSANAGLQILIAGHTDSDHSEAYNRDLSLRRAQSVKNYFVARGLAAERFSTIGYGEAHPVASNATEGGQAQNRRVELILREQSVADWPAPVRAAKQP